MLLSVLLTFPVTTPGLNPLYLLYSSKNQAISRAPVFMSGAGMSSLGPMISLMACRAGQEKWEVWGCWRRSVDKDIALVCIPHRVFCIAMNSVLNVQLQPRRVNRQPLKLDAQSHQPQVCTGQRKDAVGVVCSTTHPPHLTTPVFCML